MFVIEQHKKEVYNISINVSEVLKYYSMRIVGHGNRYIIYDFKILDTNKSISEDEFIRYLALECGYNPFSMSHAKLDFMLTGDFVDRVGVEIPIEYLTSMNLIIEFDKDLELEEENDDEEGEE